MPLPIVIMETVLSAKWTPLSIVTDFPKSHSKIILDYDDTIFPSSWLKDNGMLDIYTQCPSHVFEICEKIAKSVETLIREAQKHADVVIITNADEGWVQESCSIFMPSIYMLITSLKIISAQTRYKHITPLPLEWKRLAFSQYLWDSHPFENTDTINVLSIGDGKAEQYAVHTLCQATMGTIKSKSLKFMEKSEPTQLIQQIELASANIPAFVKYPLSLDIKMDKDDLPNDPAILKVPSNDSLKSYDEVKSLTDGV